MVFNPFCCVAGNFFPNSARSHWSIRGHMTSNNETFSRQNLWAGNVAKSMTSEGNSARLPAKVNRWPPLQRGLMNSHLQNFYLHNKSLKVWSLGKQIMLFPENVHLGKQKLTVYLGTSHYVFNITYRGFLIFSIVGISGSKNVWRWCRCLSNSVPRSLVDKVVDKRSGYEIRAWVSSPFFLHWRQLCEVIFPTRMLNV